MASRILEGSRVFSYNDSAKAVLACGAKAALAGGKQGNRWIISPDVDAREAVQMGAVLSEDICGTGGHSGDEAAVPGGGKLARADGLRVSERIGHVPDGAFEFGLKSGLCIKEFAAKLIGIKPVEGRMPDGMRADGNKVVGGEFAHAVPVHHASAGQGQGIKSGPREEAWNKGIAFCRVAVSDMPEQAVESEVLFLQGA